MNILSSFLTLMSIHTCISSFLMLNTKSFWRTKQLLVPIENIFFYVQHKENSYMFGTSE